MVITTGLVLNTGKSVYQWEKNAMGWVRNVKNGGNQAIFNKLLHILQMLLAA